MKKADIIILFLTVSLNASSQYYVFDSIPDKLKNRAFAVVRSEQCLYTISKPGNAVLKFKKAITLLNEFANPYRQVQVPYDKYSKVNYLRGTIYDEKGSIIKVMGVSNIFDKTAVSGGTFYSDDRMKTMVFPLYKYPYTIEYEYEIAYTSILNYPTWSFQDSPNVSVEKSGIQFIVPENMNLRYYEEYLNCKVDTVSLDGNKIYTWQEENLFAYQNEDYSIKRVYHSPVVHTAPLDFEYGGYEGSMSSWKDFGTWVYEINKERDALPEEEVTAVKKLTANSTDIKEKIRLVYEYLQSKTRYLSIQIGIGGYRTALASAVAKNGFGDCKALVNYTSALLKSVGINSFYTLVKAGTTQDINKDFVSNQFNHVILSVPVPGDTIWLECTSQTIPFNYLSSSTAGKNVLMLTPEGGRLVKTPEFSKEENIERRTGSAYLNVLGTTSGNFSTFYSGNNFNLASGRYYMESEDEMKRSLYNSLRFTDFTISSVTYSENKAVNPSARLTCLLNVKNFASVNAKRMYFNPSITIEDYLPVMPNHYIIPVPDITSDSISYNLPLNFMVEYLPPAVNIESEFGKFQCNMETKGDKIIFRRLLELNKSDIPVEKYDDFRNFVNSIAKADREKVILIRSGV